MSDTWWLFGFVLYSLLMMLCGVVLGSNIVFNITVERKEKEESEDD